MEGMIFMLLVVDIGNTHTVVGVFKEEELICHWRLRSHNRTADEIGVYLLNLLKVGKISTSQIKGAVMSSVVPPLDYPWACGIKQYLNVDCLKVSSNLNLGIRIAYENPTEVGADRLVNAVAGLKKYHAPMIIVDFGTAITLDVVSKDREYLGGIIAPGLATSVEALFGKTAKLPKVSFDVPETVIGKNTMESIQSGILYGFAGLVDHLVEKIEGELGGELTVIATGGDAQKIASLSEKIQYVDPWLTLEGLRFIYEQNANRLEEV